MGSLSAITQVPCCEKGPMRVPQCLLLFDLVIGPEVIFPKKSIAGPNAHLVIRIANQDSLYQFVFKSITYGRDKQKNTGHVPTTN